MTDDAAAPSQDAHDLVHYQLMPDIPRMISVLSQKTRDYQRSANRRRKMVLFRPLEGKDGYEKTRTFPITEAKYKDDPRFQAILARRDEILELRDEAFRLKQTIADAQNPDLPAEVRPSVAMLASAYKSWVDVKKLIEQQMRGLGNELAQFAADEAKIAQTIHQTITRLADLAEDRRYNNKRIKEIEAADPMAASNEQLEAIRAELEGAP